MFGYSSLSSQVGNNRPVWKEEVDRCGKRIICLLKLVYGVRVNSYWRKKRRRIFWSRQIQPKRTHEYNTTINLNQQPTDPIEFYIVSSHFFFFLVTMYLLNFNYFNEFKWGTTHSDSKTLTKGWKYLNYGCPKVCSRKTIFRSQKNIILRLSMYILNVPNLLIEKRKRFSIIGHGV